MKRTENQQEMNAQRKRYLDGEITHQEYYLWLASFIGATAQMVPATTREEIAQSTDEHLNDIPLARWDACDPQVRRLAYAKGLPWALSDTVCVLKCLAREMLKVAA